MNNKPLFLFVGKSASGKTTIANMLEADGYTQVNSYTTRPPRYEGEIGHIFVNENEFNNLGELAAYTFYNGNHYGTTFAQINNCDIYVIDTYGIETLLQKYNQNRAINIIYFDTSITTRINRMKDRGDADCAIIERLYNDEQFNWYDTLNSLVLKYNNDKYLSVNLYIIDANQSLEDVYGQFYHIERRLP